MSQSSLDNLSHIRNQTMIQGRLDYSSSTDLTATFAQVDKLLFNSEGRKSLGVLGSSQYR